MYKEEDMVEVTGTCRICGNLFTMKVREEDYNTLLYDDNRPKIQDLFPYLSPPEREFLITRTCPECWQRMFGQEEDEEDEA